MLGMMLGEEHGVSRMTVFREVRMARRSGLRTSVGTNDVTVDVGCGECWC